MLLLFRNNLLLLSYRGWRLLLLLIQPGARRVTRSCPSTVLHHLTYGFPCPALTPTVSLDVPSLVESSCGYYRGQSEQRAAHSFAVHIASRTWQIGGGKIGFHGSEMLSQSVDIVGASASNCADAADGSRSAHG